MNRPKLLIEEWFPVEVVGAECMRERGASSALPPLYFLHVWWARRPLTVSRAAILGSVLPAWSERGRWPADLQRQFASEEAYHEWFLRLLGIFGDPAATRRQLTLAKARKVNLGPDPYGYKRAFTYNPSEKQVETLRRLLEATWGKADLAVMDPMSGGGSIPFEALRFGFETYANELNPVASTILKATLDYPRRFGAGLAEDIRRYGEIWAARVRERLEPFFPVQPGENVHAYLWARTVNCPRTGKPVPLSPNWWLLQGSDPVALRLIADPKEAECRFEVVRGREACRNADQGSVKRGHALSPWSGEILPNAFLKAEAEAGRMGQQLLAVARKRSGGFDFRAATPSDLQACREAEEGLRRAKPAWEAKGLFPSDLLPMDTESWTHGNTAAQYGAREFGDLFSPRQLLALTTALEELRDVQEQAARELEPERAKAVGVCLALALDKGCDRNSRMARWIPQRQVIANTFDRHDFAFKWSYAEFDAARNMFPWGVSQIVDSFQEIAKLVLISGGRTSISRKSIKMSNSSAGAFQGTSKLQLVCTDPPYYDNVMYAELSDFFYVWLRRSAGHLLPEFFEDRLTNKEDEAVANPARFHGQKGSKDLAARDYERKMAAAFQRMVEHLDDRGAMTVMFTNKRVEAWNALAQSLITAGLEIHTSWPIHTEFQNSLHIAQKNAAQSTVLLVCRKRQDGSGATWWDEEFQERLAEVVRSKAAEFEAHGMTGVDLYLSTFGPVLEQVSQHWPVRDPQGGEPIAPDKALDLARRVVGDYRIAKLAATFRSELDPLTRWYILAWDLFRAAQFPFDEGRKLALVAGGEVPVDEAAEEKPRRGRGKTKDQDFLEVLKARSVVAKKGDYLQVASPTDRHRLGRFDTAAKGFACTLDALHAALVLWKEDGLRGVDGLLKRANLLRDAAFLSAFEALYRAIPPVREEWKGLEAIRAEFLDDRIARLPLAEEDSFDPDLFAGEGDEEGEDLEDDEE